MSAEPESSSFKFSDSLGPLLLVWLFTTVYTTRVGFARLLNQLDSEVII